MYKTLRRQISKRVRGYAPELIYPVPTSALQVERLYTWFDHLVTRRDVPGDVVEVGCYLGGTSALSWRLLQRTQQNRRYICVELPPAKWTVGLCCFAV